MNQCFTTDFFVVHLNAEGPTAKRNTTEANRQQTDSESVCHKVFLVFDLNAGAGPTAKRSTIVANRLTVNQCVTKDFLLCI